MFCQYVSKNFVNMVTTCCRFLISKLSDNITDLLFTDCTIIWGWIFPWEKGDDSKCKHWRLRLDYHGLQSNLSLSILHVHSADLRNLYYNASFIQWPEESCESEEPILNCFIYSVIWEIQWIWGTYTELLYLFSYMRNPVNLRYQNCIASFIQWSEESIESEVSILYCFIYSVIWWIQWIWGTGTVLLYLFSDLRNPVNLRFRYCTASFIQWSGESIESEDPTLNCFINSVFWGIQWIWGTYTVQLYLFSDLKNPVNLRNLYWTALFIQWSEESSESEEPILYWFIYSVIWGIQWIWGT